MSEMQSELNNEKISDNKACYLLDILRNNPDYFRIYDTSQDENGSNKTYEALKNLSYKQYRYLLALYFNKKYFELKKFLDNVGAKKIIIN